MTERMEQPPGVLEVSAYPKCRIRSQGGAGFFNQNDGIHAVSDSVGSLKLSAQFGVQRGKRQAGFAFPAEDEPHRLLAQNAGPVIQQDGQRRHGFPGGV